MATKTIKEPARNIKVVQEADVVVVGGGPGGIGAAVAAARNGARTVLIERYGHLGGMAIGGLVTLIPNLDDINGVQQIAGMIQEWIDRLDVREAACYPKKEEWGSTDKKLAQHWADRMMLIVHGGRVTYTVLTDAEILKCVCNDMVEGAGVKTYLHSWGSMPIMEGNICKGVIFESKSGRQAILGKIVIDSTGDGDLLPYAGIEFEDDVPPNFRIAKLSLLFRMGGVDVTKYEEFKRSNPQQSAEQDQELAKLGGAPFFWKTNLKNQESVLCIATWFANKSQVDVEELTRVEFEGRKQMLITLDYRMKNTPGFENSFIMLTAPQMGTRTSRRLAGVHRLCQQDMEAATIFDDTIAIFPAGGHGGPEPAKKPVIYVPYRCMVPRKVDNLLVACRAFSSDTIVQERFNLIPHCIALGQAAGTAAALSAKAGISPRNVDYKTLKKKLLEQGVPLPGLLPGGAK